MNNDDNDTKRDGDNDKKEEKREGIMNSKRGG
jgi:hypothetical protein